MQAGAKRQGWVKRVVRCGYDFFASPHNTLLAQVVIIILLSLIALFDVTSRLLA